MARSPSTVVFGPVGELFRPFPVLNMSGAQAAVAGLMECDSARFLTPSVGVGFAYVLTPRWWPRVEVLSRYKVGEKCSMSIN